MRERDRGREIETERNSQREAERERCRERERQREREAERETLAHTQRHRERDSCHHARECHASTPHVNSKKSTQLEKVDSTRENKLEISVAAPLREG